MKEMQNVSQKPEWHSEPRFKALVPFFVFVAFYLGLSLVAHDFYLVPMPIAFIVASATALMLDHKKPLMEKVEAYASGMGEVNIMLMCLIFILAGAFASTAKGMGAVDSAVLIARHLIPAKLMLCGIFLVSCFISLAIGTSCGTIAALVPIAVTLCAPMHISEALMLGAVVGGAMFGDNLSMISDTTIAATRTQHVQMKDKFLTNLKMVLPAAVIVTVIYLLNGQASADGEALKAIGMKDCLAVLPYVMILVLALCGFNVMSLLFFGTVLAFVIGVCTGTFDAWKGLKCAGDGALGMSETLIVAILAGGLLKVIRCNGGVDYLIKLIEKGIKTSRGCEFGVMFLVAVVNLFTANNTVAIVVSGPIAYDLSIKYSCDRRRIASILDTTSCVVQGLIPYGAQILIAVSLTYRVAGKAVLPIELIGSLYYPIAILAMLILWIIFSKRNKVSAS